MKNKKIFPDFRPIGNSEPRQENKYIFIAMVALIVFAILLILRAIIG